MLILSRLKEKINDEYSVELLKREAIGTVIKKNTHNIDIDSPISLCMELIRTAQIHRKKKRNPFVITMARNTHDYLTNLIIFVRAAMHR